MNQKKLSNHGLLVESMIKSVISYIDNLYLLKLIIIIKMVNFYKNLTGLLVESMIKSVISYIYNLYLLKLIIIIKMVNFYKTLTKSPLLVKNFYKIFY